MFRKNLIKKLFLFFSLLSFIQYLYCPNYYSFGYILFLFLLFCVDVYLYFKIKKKKNYFDFDTLFLFVFSLAAFAYPVFLYEPSFPFIYFFGFSFNVDTISHAVSISLIAINCYLLGSVSLTKKEETASRVIYVNNRLLIFLSCLLFVLFICSGGVSYYQAMYGKSANAELSGPINQLQSLLQATLIATIGTEFYNLRACRKKPNKLFLLVCVTLSFLMLYAGNRTFAMQILLPTSFFLFYYYYQISFSRFILLAIIGFFSMWFIQINRTGKTIDENIIINSASVISDIVIPSRSNFLVFEVVDKTGFTYGYSMSGGVIGVIPSLERFLNLVGLDSKNTGSATLFTRYTLGDNPSVGLGTMLQADIYLSFGLVGILLFFWGLGKFVNRIQMQLQLNVYYSYIIYSALMAHAVFWVRAEATYPLRIIIWSLIIAYLNKLYWNCYAKKDNVFYSKSANRRNRESVHHLC